MNRRRLRTDLIVDLCTLLVAGLGARLDLWTAEAAAFWVASGVLLTAYRAAGE